MKRFKVEPQRTAATYEDGGDVFEPTRMKNARQRRGQSIVDIERATGINRGRLWRFEASRVSPKVDEVDAIAHALDWPVGFFYRDAMPEIPSSAISWPA